MPQHQDLKLLRPLRTTTQNQQLEQTADNPVSEGQTLKQQTSNTHLPTLPGRTTPSTPPSPSAHAPQKPPNEFVGPTGLEGNVSARSAPPPEAACDAEAEELSTNGAEDKWSSWAVPGLPRLPAVAAVQAAGCSRPACESQPRVGFPGVAARLFTLAAAAQMAKHRSEPAAEPNFFTPQPKIWFRLQIELIRWGGQNFGTPHPSTTSLRDQRHRRPGDALTSWRDHAGCASELVTGVPQVRGQGESGAVVAPDFSRFRVYLLLAA